MYKVHICSLCAKITLSSTIFSPPYGYENQKKVVLEGREVVLTIEELDMAESVEKSVRLPARSQVSHLIALRSSSPLQ